MSFTYDDEVSIRENALRAIVELLDTQQEGVPEADPYDFEWGVVRRTRLTPGDCDENQFAIAVLPRENLPTLEAQSRICDLEITLEFSAKVQDGQEPESVYETVITNLVRRLGSDPRLTGIRNNTYPVITGGPALVIAVSVLGDEGDVDGWSDDTITGVQIITMKWRERLGDPRQVVPQ